MPPSEQELNRAILNTLVYADVFDYPLTLAEIHRYLAGVNVPLETVSTFLDTSHSVQCIGPYYTLPGREAIIQTRMRREQEAARLWRAARAYGKVISALPFVRMVAVTGSLAMNNVDANADIDYLVVTMPGRLWMCRLLVLVVTRVAALSGISLCPNYLLTLNSLEITERSLYAAHEFTQMIPLSGMDTYQHMVALNPWVRDYLPNADGMPGAALAAPEAAHSYPLRSLLERILMTRPAGWLEDWEMRRKIHKLSLENSGNPEAAFSTDQCKGHSNRHGERTNMLMNERLTRLPPEYAK